MLCCPLGIFPVTSCPGVKESGFCYAGMITPLSSTPTATQSARPETAAFGSPFKPFTALRPLSRSYTGSRSVRMPAHDASANQPSAVRALTASLQLLSTTANGYEEDYSDDGDVDNFASRSPRSPPFRLAHRRQGAASHRLWASALHPGEIVLSGIQQIVLANFE